MPTLTKLRECVPRLPSHTGCNRTRRSPMTCSSASTDTIIHGTTSTNSSSLGRSSRAASCLLLLSSVLSIFPFVTSVRSRSPTFGADSVAFLHQWFHRNCTHLGAIHIRLNRRHDRIPVPVCLVTWAVLIKRVGDGNSWTVQPAQSLLGIQVSTGVGLPFGWIAFSLLVMSVMSHTIESPCHSFDRSLRFPSPDLLFTLSV